ncbi:MAG TPA: hypothetical protein VJ879_01310 [Desulfobacter sp.]|nr:hypothetical protein [Desulfobacter sp.]
MKAKIYIAAILILIWWWFCFGTTTIIFVRHLNRGGNIDALNATGIARAT